MDIFPIRPVCYQYGNTVCSFGSIDITAHEITGFKVYCDILLEHVWEAGVIDRVEVKTDVVGHCVKFGSVAMGFSVG